MKLRKDFPILKNNPDLIYLDSAATSQKPQVVIEAISDWYKKHNANIHRGVYGLAEEATRLYNQARSNIARFIGAGSNEVVFTKGATEGINLVAYSWARNNLKKGDKILLTKMEHHANLLPWQEVAGDMGLELAFLDFDDHGKLDLADLEAKLKQVKLVSLVFASNVLGTINPLKKIIGIAKKHKVPVLADASQIVGHRVVNVKKLGVDWLVFSGHKVLGPTGVGVLYVKKNRLKEMRPYQTGGDMIKQVSLEQSIYLNSAGKFEAGTQNLAGVFGLSRAIDYLGSVGLGKIEKHEKNLVDYALSKLKRIPEVEVYGPKKRIGLISFSVKGLHPHDLATMLAEHNICVRAGHHCCEPLHKELGVVATTRISFQIYNTLKDIDIFISALEKIIRDWQSQVKKHV